MHGSSGESILIQPSASIIDWPRRLTDITLEGLRSFQLFIMGA